MKSRLFTLLLFITIYSYGQKLNTTAQQQIIEIMKFQEDCWNKGNIPCFMESYWHSDSLKFIGSNGITYGWKNTLDNYLKKYPNTKIMGQLKFKNIEINLLTPTLITVVGKWHLKRKMGNVSGYYSLVWQKINGYWKIISDHSS